MRHPVSTATRWIGRHELTVLCGLAVIALGTWSFVELAGEVVDGDTQVLDERILRSLRSPDDPLKPIGPPWMIEACRDVTALGGYVFLGFLLASVSVFLRLVKMYHAMWFVLGAVISGYFVLRLLKAFFGRPRPDIVPHLSVVYDFSFPSGHSMMSAVVFLTLGSLLSRLTTRLSLKVYFLSIAVILTVAVGVTRVYLGVHYPTDVLAGWTCGLVWAMLCSLVARHLQRRGEIEKGFAREREDA